MRSRAVAAAAALLALLLTVFQTLALEDSASSLTQAASGWTPAVAVSGRLDASAVLSGAPPSVAVTPNGRAHVVWAAGRRVMLSVRRPGGSWSARVLHRADRPYRTWSPQVATDARGDMVVAWEQGRSVRALWRPAGGSWGPAVRVAAAPRRQAILSHPFLTVGADGTALVAFWRGRVAGNPGGFDDLKLVHLRGVAVVRPPAGSWRPPSKFGGIRGPVHGWCNYALGPTSFCDVRSPTGAAFRGTVVVGWSQPGYMEGGPAYARTRSAAGVWSPRVQLSPGHGSVIGPELAVTSWGQVTAAWAGGGGGYSRTQEPGGRWGPRQLIDRACARVEVGVDGTGQATALCATPNGMVTLTRPRWGSWSTRTVVSRRTDAWTSPTLGVDTTGETVAAWSTGNVTQAIWRASGQPWPPATALGPPGVGVEVAIGEDDTAAVTWFHTFGPTLQGVVVRASVHPAW